MTRRHAVALAVILVALAIRLTFALGMPSDEPDDGRMYSLMAHNLNANGVYSNDDEAPYGATYVRVPGYPLFLAAIYRVFGDGNNTAVRVVQALVDTGTCVLVALVTLTWSPQAWSVQRRQRAATRRACARHRLSVRGDLRHHDPHRDAGVRAGHGRPAVRLTRLARRRLRVVSGR